MVSWLVNTTMVIVSLVVALVVPLVFVGVVAIGLRKLNQGG